MGYYNDVAYSYEGPTDEIITVLTAFRLKSKDAMDVLKDFRCITVNNITTITFHDESTKWDSSYPEVHALKELYSAFEAFDNKCSGAFMRIGEESGDEEHEYFGEGDSLLEYTRCISFPAYINDDIPFSEFIKELPCPT